MTKDANFSWNVIQLFRKLDSVRQDGSAKPSEKEAICATLRESTESSSRSETGLTESGVQS